MSKLIYILFFLFFSLKIYSQEIKFTEEEKTWIENNRIVYFGYDPSWSPYEFYSNGKYSGICGDFLNLISKKVGVKFVPLKNMNWEKSYKDLKNNNLTMVTAAGVSEERSEFLIFTDKYLKLPVVIAQRNDNEKISDFSDLDYKTISLPKNYMQEEKIKIDFPNIKIIERNNIAECLQDVSTGISVATIESMGTISYFINEKGFNNLTISSQTFYPEDGVAFAFPKSQVLLRNIMNKALKTISESERNKINSKWISVNYKNKSDNSKFWKYIIFSLIIVLIVFIIFFIWNKSLRKQINLRKKIENELSHTLEKVNKQNKDKTILLQEIHHRVKNNLQIIISLLRLQANTHTNEDVKAALSEAVERVNSISLVHEHIYKNPNLAQIDLEKYIQDLGEELKLVFVKDYKLNIYVNTNNVELGIKPIIPLALILNELISNSLKYAFIDSKNQINFSGNIFIDLKIENNSLKLIYSDDGIWFNNSYSRNFGTYLIEIFTEQLDGTFNMTVGSKTEYIFKFKDF